jgi:hypothetical protein
MRIYTRSHSMLYKLKHQYYECSMLKSDFTMMEICMGIAVPRWNPIDRVKGVETEKVCVQNVSDTPP